jgi:hypothetical protein
MLQVVQREDDKAKPEAKMTHVQNAT